MLVQHPGRAAVIDSAPGGGRRTFPEPEHCGDGPVQGIAIAWGQLDIADVLAEAHRRELHRQGMDLPGQGDWLSTADSASNWGDEKEFRDPGACADAALPDDESIPTEVLPLEAIAGHVMTAPGPGLAGWLACTQRRELDDAALITSITGWRKLASWAQSQELAAVAELARRRGAAADGIEPGRPGDGGTGAAGDGEEGRAATADLRELAAEFAPSEVALALNLTRTGAEYWMDLAVSLDSRLPRTLAALSKGQIDLQRARLIDQYTGQLSGDLARKVEEKVLPKAETQTSGQLRAALQRAVISTDPAAAERRRQESEANARVELFGDHEGTASLGGRFLPAAQATAAWARICAMARAMESAGAPGGADLLRAQVFVGLLLGTLPLVPPPQEGPGGVPPPGPDREPPWNGEHADDPEQGYPGGAGDAAAAQGTGTGAALSHENPSRKAGSREAASSGDAIPHRQSGRAQAAGQSSPGSAGTRPSSANASPGHGGTSLGVWPPVPAPGQAPAPGCAQGWPGRVPHRPGPTRGPASPAPPSGRTDPGSPSGRAGPVALHGQAGPVAPRGRVAPGSPHGRASPGPPSGRASLATMVVTGPGGRAGNPGSRPGAGSGQRTRRSRSLSRDGKAFLTVPWQTLAGLASEPGVLSRIGPVTAQAARSLAAAAARERGCEWKLVLAGRAGHALAVTSVPRTWLPRRARSASPQGGTGQEPPPADAAALMARVTLTMPLAALDRLSELGAGAWACPPELRDLLTAALRAGIRLAGRFRAGQMGLAGLSACTHEGEVPGYRVPASLRALVEARDQTCRFPCCRQPAWRCDQDHTLGYERGGRTCACNLSSECRHHHRLKQQRGWLLTQARPGVLTWRTPAGLTYQTSPEPHTG